SEGVLCKDGVFGLEVEVRFAPYIQAPLFTEICSYLETRGYRPYNVSMGRCSRRALPLELAADHRDHLNRPIVNGPTVQGQLMTGDIVFFRDLIGDGFEITDQASAARVLKAAAVFEIYKLPDCAAELLQYYRRGLSAFPVDNFLDCLVPDIFGRPI